MTGATERSDAIPEIYWRPGCPYCSSLRRQLKRRQVVASWHNIWEDGQAGEFVRGVNGGNETAPTVRVGARILTNPNGAQVARMVGHASTPGPSSGRRDRVRGRLTRWLSGRR